MEISKKYFKYINVTRLVSCIGVLLYHLNILKGGYLAVCVFFVLSGYLACMSAFKEDKFSFKKYYVNKIKRIYLPLLIVVLVTIAALSSSSWLNLKPETTSVVFGFNNFWQLNANLDYFTRHVDSPFMHLWYIAILIQFYAVFPFLFIVLRKLGDKSKKILPCIITVALSVIFALVLYMLSLTTDNITSIYYNTLTRMFSLLFGVALGFIHSYYDISVPKMFRKDSISKTIFFIYLIALLSLFIFVDVNTFNISFGLIIATILSTRLIAYSVTVTDHKLSKLDKIVKSLSDVSYEIYLIQYPVIYVFQEVNLSGFLKVICIIAITILLSYILHYTFSIKNKKGKIILIRLLTTLIILSASIYGAYLYIIAEDHTEEMNRLKEQLAQNELMIKEKQKNYEEMLNKEAADFQATLSSLENDESKLGEVVTNLPIVCIGDSVMLGAVNNIYAKFPNGYVDAAISRTAWILQGMINSLKSQNRLGSPIIINLGTNGDCSESCKESILSVCENRDVFWINVTNSNTVNANLANFALKHDNVNIIDWKSISAGHSEYFYSDGIHLTLAGRDAYTNAIYDAIYKLYKEKIEIRKQDAINKYTEEEKNKITFYGNELLLNVFDSIKDNYATSNFIINKGYNYEALKEDIKQALSSNSLTYRVVFMFNGNISLENYNELVSLCADHEVYIIALNMDIADSVKNYDNVKVIDLYSEIKINPDYLFVDRKHLSDKGILALKNMLVDSIK